VPGTFVRLLSYVTIGIVYFPTPLVLSIFSCMSQVRGRGSYCEMSSVGVQWSEILEAATFSESRKIRVFCFTVLPTRKDM
jgi:hypothetical protein